MKFLVINCGSSSIKYQLFNMASKVVLAKGVAEKVGMKGSFIKLEKNDGSKVIFNGEILDHQTGIEYILGVLTSSKHGSLKTMDEIVAVGHRVAHGGEKFDESQLITNDVINDITHCSELAPLHNPANLKGILAMKALLPNVPQVATFDTAFHQSMPAKAYMYALPYSLYTKYGIRRYGFHGTSHSFIATRACEMLGKDISQQRIVTCHLGNGASVCAIKNGKSVDTSMGLTPVEGLVMGTRSGDVDAGVLTFIMEKEEIDPEALNTLVNKHSGLLGVSGVSSDMREVMDHALNKDNEKAQLALDMVTYRIKKYIGAYAAGMGGIDILIFAGGIGENNFYLRKKVCEELEFLGVEFDSDKNDGVMGREMVISKDSSRVNVVTVPTDEELVIAEDTLRIVSGLGLLKK